MTGYVPYLGAFVSGTFAFLVAVRAGGLRTAFILLPGKGALATFSPPLDSAGNSVRGQLVALFLADRLGLNLFASERADAHRAAETAQKAQISGT